MVYCTPSFGMGWYRRINKPNGGTHLKPLHQGKASPAVQKAVGQANRAIASEPAENRPFIFSNCPRTGFHYAAYDELSAKDPDLIYKLEDALDNGFHDGLLAQLERAAQKHLSNYKARCN